MANIIALDVGTKRIGVAFADDQTPIATPLETVDVNGSEVRRIAEIIKERNVQMVVVGYPRNQSGNPTQQTGFAEVFASRIREYAKTVFQDESLTSVMAEESLQASGKPYSKSDIDALAATIILQDYLEQHHVAK